MRALTGALGLAIAGVTATAATVRTMRPPPRAVSLVPIVDACGQGHISWLAEQVASLDDAIAAHAHADPPLSGARVEDDEVEPSRDPDGLREWKRDALAAMLHQCIARD